jgi:Tfp pilus assembly protein PilE
MEKNIRNKGITLIALVVTIIILLILAGISIQAIINNNLIQNATTATEIYNKEQAKEKLIQTLNSLAISKYRDKNYNDKEYIDNQIKKDGMSIDSDDIVTVNKYKFKIDREKLEIIEEAGKEELSDFEKLQSSYVQDGLVCWYDGIYNTVSGHDKNATVWQDLTGNNNNGTLKNINNTDDSGWTSNSLILDGIDDWVQMTQIPASEDGITVEIVAKVLDVSEGSQENYICNYESGGIGITQNLGKIRESAYIEKYVGFYDEKNINISQIYSMSTGVDKKNETMYSSINNNKQISIFGGQYSEPQNNTVFVIGTNPNGNQSDLPTGEKMPNIEVYSIRIYNRSLTADEISKNYEEDKRRFQIEDIKDNPSASELGYVSNGLMCLYDGEYNSEFGKSKKTKTWYDLSKNNNNATLKNFDFNKTSGWTGNSLLLDGKNDWVSMQKIYNNNMTVEIALKILNEKDGKKLYVIDNYESGGMGIEKNTSGYMLGAVNVDGSYYTALSNNKINDNTKYSLTLQYDGSNILYRENDIKYNTYAEGRIKEPINSTRFVLGVNASGENYDNMESSEAFNNFEVYSVRIYNRALTDEEISQNYNVDKERFGI